MTSYESAVAQLYKLGYELARTAGHKFDLELVRALLAGLDHPEQRFASVLIAGTNGKGSTAATLASILQAAGHRAALYTSPHLLRVNERIRVNGEEITDAEFAAAYDRVEQAAQSLLGAGQLPWHPSFFEMLTAMAFTHFAASRVEVAVLEVGMGGRLDATNVVDPLVSVVTDISLDHERFLGSTVREIAREKAGIIRAKGIVVTLPQHPEANEVIGQTILERGALAISAVPFVPPFSPAATPALASSNDQAPLTSSPGFRNQYPVDVMGEQIVVDSPLLGRHQWRNLALAIAAAEQLNRLGVRVTPQNVATGIRQTRWPGRFEVIAADPQRGLPETVLDGAHNPAGAWALRAALSQRYFQSADDAGNNKRESGGRPLIFVFAAMRDKAIGEIVSILFPLARHVIATRAHTPRSAAPEEICTLGERIFKGIETKLDVILALERAFSLAKQDSVVVVAGSIYIVGEAIAALKAREEQGVASRPERR
jgi:dihydrofolate synthase/folylpolyglutamate synthase